MVKRFIYDSFNEFKSAIEATGAEFRSDDQPLSIDPDAPAPNIIRFATQLDVLRQSDVFITHGGINSVHESLWFGGTIIRIAQGNKPPHWTIA